MRIPGRWWGGIGLLLSRITKEFKQPTGHQLWRIKALIDTYQRNITEMLVPPQHKFTETWKIK